MISAKSIWRFLFSLTVFFSPALATAEKMAVPEKIVVMGKTLVRKSYSQNDQKLVAEYILDGETFDNWKVMFAVRFTKAPPVNINAQAQALMQNIKTRKAGGDPVANGITMISPDKKSVVTDFIMSDKKADIFERNVQRFFNISGGLVSYQYAERHYGAYTKDGEASKKFLREIPLNRKALMEALMDKSLPLSNAN